MFFVFEYRSYISEREAAVVYGATYATTLTEKMNLGESKQALFHFCLMGIFAVGRRRSLECTVVQYGTGGNRRGRSLPRRELHSMVKISVLAGDGALFDDKPGHFIGNRKILVSSVFWHQSLVCYENSQPSRLLVREKKSGLDADH